MISGIIEDLDIYKLRINSDARRTLHPEIIELANSISQKGLLNPIIVRPKDGFYEIVAGNRRFEACKTLGWRKIICNVTDLDDKDAFEISLIENIQRKSLNPLEEAYAFKAYVNDFGWGGISELATKIGRSISYVDKRLRLLDLPPEIIENILSDRITTTAAEELISVTDSDKQCELTKVICEQSLSSREVRNLVRDLKTGKVDKDNKNSGYEIEMFYTRKTTTDEISDRAFDRSIVVLKIAINKLAHIIESVEDNWVIYEILMQHKNMLNSQIDLLIKEKKKS